MIARILAVLLVAAVVVATFFVNRPAGISGPAQTVQDGRPDLGYAARDAEIVETGPDGLPVYTLSAGLIRQRPEESSVLLEDVRMQYRDENGDVWHLSAAEGTILQDSGIVRFAGNVRVSGSLSRMSQAAQITTEQLAFDTREEVVSTDAPVVLEWGDGQLRARGLVASLKGGRLQLESDVHGLFAQ